MFITRLLAVEFSAKGVRLTATLQVIFLEGPPDSKAGLPILSRQQDTTHQQRNGQLGRDIIGRKLILLVLSPTGNCSWKTSTLLPEQVRYQYAL